MPAPQDTQHRWINNTALPFATNVSPVDETPLIFKGYNTLATLKHELNRRPGFATAIEAVPTTFAGRIETIYAWRKWNGSNFLMLSVYQNFQTSVYKLEIGKDNSFVQIFTVNSSTAFDFVASNNCVFFDNGTGGNVYDGKNLYSWGMAGPIKAPITNIVGLVAGQTAGITCQTDYHYRYTYWDANAGHESSPSDINDCLGQFSNSGVSISVFHSPNPRVTHIRVYRTTDGGSVDPTQMQELPQSPIANADASIVDYTADGDLREQFAPALLVNDPPPPLTGVKQSGSRIYGMNSNQVWFSGFDEVVNGVQQECFKSGLTGNYFAFGEVTECLQPVGGQNAGLAVLQPGIISMIQGDLRNQISKFDIESKHGARNSKASAGFGSDAAWFDSSLMVRTAQSGELSREIRETVKTIDPNWVQFTAHIGGGHQWLCMLDGIAGTLYVYDIDLNFWQTPWPIGATAIHSGEVSPGTQVLYAAINGTVYYMTEGKYNDAGKPYPASMRTGLIPLAPLATTSNQIVQRVNPELVQAVDAIIIERDIHDISDIRINFDELPETDNAYISIVANAGDPTEVQPRKSLITKRYTLAAEMGMAERASVQIDWPAVDSNFRLFSVDTEIHSPVEAQ